MRRVGGQPSFVAADFSSPFRSPMARSAVAAGLVSRRGNRHSPTSIHSHSRSAEEEAASTLAMYRKTIYDERYHRYYHHLCQRAAHFDVSRRRQFPKNRARGNTLTKVAQEKRVADTEVVGIEATLHNIESRIIRLSDGGRLTERLIAKSVAFARSLWAVGVVGTFPAGGHHSANNNPKPIKKEGQAAKRKRSKVFGIPGMTFVGLRLWVFGASYALALFRLAAAKKRVSDLSRAYESLKSGTPAATPLDYHYYDYATNSRLHPRPNQPFSLGVGTMSKSSSPEKCLSERFLKETALTPGVLAEVNTFFHLATIGTGDASSVPVPMDHEILRDEKLFDDAEIITVCADDLDDTSSSSQSVENNMPLQQQASGTSCNSASASPVATIPYAHDISSESAQTPPSHVGVLSTSSQLEAPSSPPTLPIDVSASPAYQPQCHPESSYGVNNSHCNIGGEEHIEEKNDAATSFRNYQESALKEVLAAIEAHKRRQALSLANGAGGDAIVEASPPAPAEPTTKEDLKADILRLQLLWYDSTAFFPSSVIHAFSSLDFSELNEREMSLLYKLATVSSTPPLLSTMGPPLLPPPYPAFVQQEVPHSHNVLANMIEGACKDIAAITQHRGFDPNDEEAVQRGLSAFAKLQFYFPSRSNDKGRLPAYTEVLGMTADSAAALERALGGSFNPSRVVSERSDSQPDAALTGSWCPLADIPGTVPSQPIGEGYASILRLSCTLTPSAFGVANRYSLCPLRVLGSDAPLGALTAEANPKRMPSSTGSPRPWRWFPNESPYVPPPALFRRKSGITLDEVSKAVDGMSRTLSTLTKVTTNKLAQQLTTRTNGSLPVVTAVEEKPPQQATLATSWPLAYILSEPIQQPQPDPKNTTSPIPNFVFPHASDMYTYSTVCQQISASAHKPSTAVSCVSAHVATAATMIIGDVVGGLLSITSTLSALLRFQMDRPLETRDGEALEDMNTNPRRTQGRKRRGATTRKQPRSQPEDDVNASDMVGGTPAQQSTSDAYAFATSLNSRRRTDQPPLEGLTSDELEMLSLPHQRRTNLLNATTLNIESTLQRTSQRQRAVWDGRTERGDAEGRRRNPSFAGLLASPAVAEQAARKAVKTLLANKLKKSENIRFPFEERPASMGDMYADVRPRLSAFEASFKAATRAVLSETETKR